MSGRVDKFAWHKAIYTDDGFTSLQRAALAYAVIVYVRGGEDTFCVRQDTIAARCKISRQTVSKAITRAKHLGYLAVEHEHPRGTNNHQADVLRLALPARSQAALHNLEALAAFAAELGRENTALPAQSQAALHDSPEQSGVNLSTEWCKADEQSGVNLATHLPAKTTPPKGLYKGLDKGSGGDAAPRTPNGARDAAAPTPHHLSIPCPWEPCQAPAGKPCNLRNGKTHPARITAATQTTDHRCTCGREIHDDTAKHCDLCQPHTATAQPHTATA